MKKMFLLALVAITFSMVGCATVTDVVGGALSGMSNGKSGSSTGVSGSTSPAATDFKSDEILCAYSSGSLTDTDYFVGKVLTAPSNSTKNQAEVISINDGSKMWTQILGSHKAAKAELKLGMYVLYGYYHESNDFDANSYRKNNWYIGRITSTDDLFKDMIEVDGKSCYLMWLRIPEADLK